MWWTGTMWDSMVWDGLGRSEIYGPKSFCSVRGRLMFYVLFYFLFSASCACTVTLANTRLFHQLLFIHCCLVSRDISPLNFFLIDSVYIAFRLHSPPDACSSHLVEGEALGEGNVVWQCCGWVSEDTTLVKMFLWFVLEEWSICWLQTDGRNESPTTGLYLLDRLTSQSQDNQIFLTKFL